MTKTSGCINICMFREKSLQVIEKIMVAAFGSDVRYQTKGQPDTFGPMGFVECKAWSDTLHAEQIEFYDFLKKNGWEDLWSVAVLDKKHKVHIFKTPEQYFKFKEDTKTKYINWELRFPNFVKKTLEQSSDGSSIYQVRCPNPFKNPRCKGIRKMTRKAVADSARTSIGICQSCAALQKNGTGERLLLIRLQASRGNMRQADFAKSIGADQAIVSNIVKAFGIDWKRSDGRASNKRGIIAI